MKIINPRFLLLVTLIGLTAFIATSYTFSPVAAGTQLEPPSELQGNPTWEFVPGTYVSTNSSNGANQPHMASAENSSDVLIAYNHWTGPGTDRDPYFSESSNDGASWSTPAPIFTSAGIDSVQVNVSYDANSVAHAVWLEAAPGNFQLKYAREDQWPGTATTIATALVTIADPKIVVSDSALHIIWAQKNLPADPVDIYHAVSTDNGNNWTTTGFIGFAEPGIALAPEAAVDTSGNLHIVWEESNPPSAEVRYAFGTVNGATVSWSIPIAIASPPDITEAREPAVAVDGSTVHVTFTNRQTVGQDVFQWAYYANCVMPCNLLGRWNSAQSISGTSLTVNALNPFFLIPSITVSDNCVYIYFHGVNPGDDNELIWGLNSCDGWSESARDQVTATNMRAIFPNIIIVGEEIFLTYEFVNPDSPTPPNQIYFLRGDLSEDIVVLLPIIQH